VDHGAFFLYEYRPFAVGAKIVSANSAAFLNLCRSQYDAQGKEDTEYRLLHVYYSAKRAISDAQSPPAAKRPKTKGRPRGGGRGGRGGRLATPRRSPKTRTVPGSAAVHQVISPAVTASTNSHCGSPGSIDTLPAPSYHFSPRTATHPGGGTRSYAQMLKDHPMPPINSHNLISFNDAEGYDKFHSAQFHPVGQNVELRQSLSFGIPGGLNPPFGNFKNDDKTNPKRRTASQQDNLMMIDTFGNADDMLTIFNDPMVSLSTKPSFDHLDPPSAVAGSSATMNTGVKSFAHHLETVHKSIRDNIRSAPSGDQCAMLSVYASWAKQISFDPMGRLEAGVSAGNTTSTKKGSTRKTSSASTVTKKKANTKARKPKRATKKKTTSAAAPSPHIMTV